MVETHYVDGELQQAWHSNGQLMIKEHYVNDKLQGLREGWYDNGRPAIKEYYIKGELHGLAEKWQTNANILS